MEKNTDKKKRLKQVKKRVVVLTADRLRRTIRELRTQIELRDSEIRKRSNNESELMKRLEVNTEEFDDLQTERRRLTVQCEAREKERDAAQEKLKTVRAQMDYLLTVVESHTEIRFGETHDNRVRECGSCGQSSYQDPQPKGMTDDERFVLIVRRKVSEAVREIEREPIDSHRNHF